ncbi:hypothetical protein SGL43_02679 [Streptomyces globisporus]|uniref:Uncharacterized protein n=1 Tax=Streptomyces globisporus TaxID=1908 RepID=A0ABM9GVT4_STRGL|nr:hypothetical protein SGL43_02679 [Streptomyces globisporus]
MSNVGDESERNLLLDCWIDLRKPGARSPSYVPDLFVRPETLQRSLPM